MIEKDLHAVNLIVSNLENFSSKADSLIIGKSKTISYPDFFDQYREYIGYLKTLHFDSNEIADLISSAPNIPKSGFSLIRLLIILPFFLYLTIVQIYLLFLIWVPILIGISIYFYVEESRKHKMGEIIHFNSRLIEVLQQ